MKRAIVWLSVAALFAGCGVSKEIVAQKDADLEACRNGLAECQSALDASRTDVSRLGTELAAARSQAESSESDLDASRRETESAQSELDRCRRDKDALDGDLQTAQEELEACRGEVTEARRQAKVARRDADAMKRQEQALRSRLQSEIDHKTVEIENLRGRLSIRVVDRILFRSGSAGILAEGKAVLDKVGSALAASPEMIRVEGHTDDVPIGPVLKEKYFSNWELSAARASSVVRYFQVRTEIDPTRLEAVGQSMYRPVAPNDSLENRQRNRRVEIVLTAPK